MKVGRAAALALIPWGLMMALMLFCIRPDGIAGDGSWTNYVWRMSHIALILYVAFTWALATPPAHKDG